MAAWIPVVGFIINIIIKLWPIAKDVFDRVNDPEQPDFTRENAIEHIKTRAQDEGMNIGNTEARIARDTVNYIENKKDRHPSV